MSAKRPGYDVVLYLPRLAPLLAVNDAGATGGAETQVMLVARALAAQGLRVCLCTFDLPDADIPCEVDGIDIVTREQYVRGGTVARLREAAALVHDLVALDARVYVTRVAGFHVGLVGLAARLRRRRFVYSAAHVADFDFRKLSPTLRDRMLHRAGLALAHHIVVQTDEQARLAAQRVHRRATVIRNMVEPVEARSDEAGKTFLWIGRAVWYKAPLAYVELARAVPEARFLAVCAPGVGADDLTMQFLEAAAEVVNLEVLGPRPRRELLPLLEHAVAIVNTSVFEGMPNATLEGWARGIPALTLSHDPDGLVERRGLGVFARDSWEDFVDGARRLWNDRGQNNELRQRCRAYVQEEHEADALARRWIEVLLPATANASPALVEVS